MNTQAESRTIRSVKISQVSFEENVRRGNRCGSTALQEAYLLFIHSLMSFTIGMLGRAGTSKIRSDVSVYWVTVSRDDAEFTKKRRQRSVTHIPTSVSCEQQLDSSRV